MGKKNQAHYSFWERDLILKIGGILEQCTGSNRPMTGCLGARGQAHVQVPGLVAAGREVWYSSQLKLSLTAAMHSLIYNKTLAHKGWLWNLLAYMYKFFAGSDTVPTMTIILNCCWLPCSCSLLLLLINKTNKVMCPECALNCQKKTDLKMAQPCPHVKAQVF